MKALLLKKPAPIEQSPLEVLELPLPEPGPTEILLRVQVCGLCHTDLHTIEGDIPLPRLPLVPGHQVVGVVEKVGGQ
ncbi:MAG: alcohol dehydrogenase catalytic domain-containing protein, partial [Chloroflexota bacterium]